MWSINLQTEHSSWREEYFITGFRTYTEHKFLIFLYVARNVMYLL